MENLLEISHSKQVYKIIYLKDWFKKNWQSYIDISESWKCRRCPQDLPCICSNPDLEWKFLRLYKAIDELLRIHRLEEYCKKEFEEFHQVKYDEVNLNIWIHKNEKVGSEELALFGYNYLNHQNPERYLRVYGYEETELKVINTIREKMNRKPKTNIDFEVFVDVIDFQYIIGYTAVFNSVYWK